MSERFRCAICNRRTPPARPKPGDCGYDYLLVNGEGFTFVLRFAIFPSPSPTLTALNRQHGLNTPETQDMVENLSSKHYRLTAKGCRA